MRPLIWVMNRSSTGLLKLFGQGDLAAQGEGHFSMTGEEIRTILSASEQEGALGSSVDHDCYVVYSTWTITRLGMP